MTRLRHLAPTLAALLALLVVVQTTDLVACADEADATEHLDGSHADPSAQGAHPAPAPGETHDESGHGEESIADCLCHVVFAPTAVVPSGDALLVPEPARFGAPVAALPEVEPSGLDHVPLG